MGSVKVYSNIVLTSVGTVAPAQRTNQFFGLHPWLCAFLWIWNKCSIFEPALVYLEEMSDAHKYNFVCVGTESDDAMQTDGEGGPFSNCVHLIFAVFLLQELRWACGGNIPDDEGQTKLWEPREGHSSDKVRQEFLLTVYSKGHAIPNELSLCPAF